MEIHLTFYYKALIITSLFAIVYYLARKTIYFFRTRGDDLQYRQRLAKIISYALSRAALF